MKGGAWLAVVPLLLVGAPRILAQQEAAPRVAFDLFAFSQADEGGNPDRSEAFGYYALRVDVRLPVSERITFRGNSTAGVVDNREPLVLPDTITNAETTSASGRVLALTSTVTTDVRLGDGDWLLSVGPYYHHQTNLFVPGLDLGLRRELAGGDTVLAADYGFRLAYDKQRYWDGYKRNREITLTHNLLLTWTQTLSPAWIGSMGLQLTRQIGYLADNLSYVFLQEGATPVEVLDESLPRERHRAQLNLRLRVSPLVGLSVGLSGSGYLDDWGIRHGAVEPGVEVPIGPLRWLVWYRFAAQRGSSYFVRRLEEVPTHYTSDSDLGPFAMHSAGTLITIPLGGQPGRATTTATVAVFGFSRDDGIHGVGGSAGAGWEW